MAAIDSISDDQMFPMKVYHGTSKEAASSIMKKGFRTGESSLGEGIYVTPHPHVAVGYSKHGGSVVEALLHPKNFIVGSSQDGPLPEHDARLDGSIYVVTDPSALTPVEANPNYLSKYAKPKN
jgi:hypothetical protein